MSRPIRLVAPFLPLSADNAHHQSLASFDWFDAIRMLSHSAELSCGVPVQVITDAAAEMPLSCLRYQTTRRRLMLWILEACVAYLESSDFDRDTVCLDCDQVIHGDLSRFFAPRMDLGIVIRPKLQHSDTWKKVINGVQFWAVRAKAALVAFYRSALAMAERLSEDLQTWGADTEALRQLLEPLSLGLHQRHGLRVHVLDAAAVSVPLSQDQIDVMQRGGTPRPMAAVTDFRYRRKVWMCRFYERTVLQRVAVCVS